MDLNFYAITCYVNDTNFQVSSQMDFVKMYKNIICLRLRLDKIQIKNCGNGKRSRIVLQELKRKMDPC